MGGEMSLFVLWSNGKPIDKKTVMKKLAAAIINEADQGRLDEAAYFVGVECGPLERAIIRANPETGGVWKDQIVAGYKKAVTNFLRSLDNRDVTQIHLGSLIGYATGGASWGDTPTETYDEWSNFFDSGEDETLEEDDREDYGPFNPYADFLHELMFLSGERITAQETILESSAKR